MITRDDDAVAVYQDGASEAVSSQRILDGLLAALRAFIRVPFIELEFVNLQKIIAFIGRYPRPSFRPCKNVTGPWSAKLLMHRDLDPLSLSSSVDGRRSEDDDGRREWCSV